MELVTNVIITTVIISYKICRYHSNIIKHVISNSDSFRGQQYNSKLMYTERDQNMAKNIIIVVAKDAQYMIRAYNLVSINLSNFTAYTSSHGKHLVSCWNNHWYLLILTAKIFSQLN